MELRRDERAVTVQIGAVLLLAIVFTALALYQVNAVPAENSAVEYEHNQQVHGELQELRNAIRSAGMTNTSRSASITLGTQYPTRSFSMNPTDPTGRLETVTPSSKVRINPKNGSVFRYETRFLAYEPDYNEYDDAPRTVMEHSLLYNQHDGANVSIGPQQLIQSERITLVLLDGNLSETQAGVTSVSLEPLDGPRTKTLEAGSVLTIPTERPAIWEDELEGTDGVTVSRTAADGEIEIVLERTFTLDIARVGVGDGVSADETFTIGTEKNAANTDETSSAYGASFTDTENAQPCSDGDSCDYYIMPGTDATFSATTTVQAADLDFAYSADGNVSIDRFNETPTNVEVRAQGPDGALIDLFVSSGDSSDTIRLKIVSESFFATTISGTNEPVVEGDALQVNATVENTGTESGQQTIQFVLENEAGDTVLTDSTTLTLSPGETQTATFQWSTGEGDAGNYTAVIASENDTTEASGLTVEEADITAFASSPNFGNNDDIDARFSVTADDGTPYQFDVILNEQGNNWRARDVTINGNQYVLSTGAADRISNNQQVDLLDSSNYASGSGQYLQSVRDDIGLNATSSTVTNAGSSALEIEVRNN